MSLREEKKQRTRDAIAAAALDLFAARGFDAVTMADVARAADVAPRTVFRYFPDKEELLFGEDDAVRAHLRAALAARPNGEPLAAAVREAATSLAAVWQDRHADGRARRAVIEASPALRARERAKQSRYERELADGLTARGASPVEARLLARAAVACFDEAVTGWLDEPRPRPPTLETRVRRTFGELSRLLG